MRTCFLVTQKWCRVFLDEPVSHGFLKKTQKHNIGSPNIQNIRCQFFGSHWMFHKFLFLESSCQASLETCPFLLPQSDSGNCLVSASLISTPNPTRYGTYELELCTRNLQTFKKKTSGSENLLSPLIHDPAWLHSHGVARLQLRPKNKYSSWWFNNAPIFKLLPARKNVCRKLRITVVDFTMITMDVGTLNISSTSPAEGWQRSLAKNTTLPASSALTQARMTASHRVTQETLSKGRSKEEAIGASPVAAQRSSNRVFRSDTSWPTRIVFFTSDVSWMAESPDLGTNTSESLQLNVLVPMRIGLPEPLPKLPESFSRSNQNIHHFTEFYRPYDIGWHPNSKYHPPHHQYNLETQKKSAKSGFSPKANLLLKRCELESQSFATSSCPPSPVDVQERNNWCCRSLPLEPPSQPEKSGPVTPQRLRAGWMTAGLQTVFILRRELLLQCWKAKVTEMHQKKKDFSPCLESTRWHPLTGQVTLFQRAKETRPASWISK